VLAHGIGRVGFHQHEDHPFTIRGILARTGTPVDDTVHVSLDAIDHIHGGVAGASSAASGAGRTITAFLVGLESRVLTFGLQRQINEYPGEPLQAIMPAVALSQLWRLVGSVESVLRVISALVLFSALLGMSTMLLASLRERRAELAVLRTIGASPVFIFALLEVEALLLCTIGLVAGMAMLGALSLAASDALQANYGLVLPPYVPDAPAALLSAAVLALAVLCAAIPALGAYRSALRGRAAGPTA
jgi:putative ABC transport system permease protein